MTEQPRVAIILLNFNGREDLQRYLPSVLDLEYPNYETIVVDNNSSDGSVEFLQSEFPEVDVIVNDENVGFSRGNNIGADVATDADYLWFMNTDVKVEPESLSLLIDHIENSDQTGAVVPRINFMSEPEMIQSVGYDLEPQWIPKGHDTGRYKPSKEEPYPVTYGSGAALLIDRDVWEETGGFDDNNFIFGDDIYLSFLVWIYGYRVEAVPESVVYHEENTQREKIPLTVAFHYGRSQMRALLKLMQIRSLAIGLPGFLMHGFYLMIGDIVLRNSAKKALYRFLGYLSPVLELGSLYRERREIQRQRVRDDDFLATGQLSTLLNMFDFRNRHPSPSDE